MSNWIYKKLGLIFLFVLILAVGPLILSQVTSAQVPEEIIVGSDGIISWDQNSELDLAGYRLWVDSTSGSYSILADVGFTGTPATPQTLLGEAFPSLPDDRYSMIATAYDLAGNESGASNQVFFVSDREGPVPVKNLKITKPQK